MDENKLTLITNDEKEITMEMEEFKKSYTGSRTFQWRFNRF